MNINNLRNVVASAYIRLGDKIEAMDTIAELNAKSQKYDFMMDYLYNDLGWSEEYMNNKYKMWLESKNKS